MGIDVLAMTTKTFNGASLNWNSLWIIMYILIYYIINYVVRWRCGLQNIDWDIATFKSVSFCKIRTSLHCLHHLAPLRKLVAS